MAKLTADDRKKMSKGSFGIPSKAPGPGSYPMPDKEHASVAIGMAEMHGGPVEKVRAKAKQLFGVGGGGGGKVPRGGRNKKGGGGR